MHCCCAPAALADAGYVNLRWLRAGVELGIATPRRWGAIGRTAHRFFDTGGCGCEGGRSIQGPLWTCLDRIQGPRLPRSRADGCRLRGFPPVHSLLLTMGLLEENFLRAVLLGDEDRFFRFGKRDRSCRLISEHGDAVNRRNELQRRCLHGFETLLVIRRRGSQVRDFFLSGGYCVEGESTVGSGQPFDVLEVPNNADLVEEGLAMLDVQPQESVCLFCHDADPAYVIESKRS